MIKRTVIISIILLLIALCLPLLFVDKSAAQNAPQETPEPSPSEASASANPLKNAYTPGKDSTISFTSLIDGRLMKVNMDSYLPGVLAAEMPASFETEALKAQAVAARTYILFFIISENPRHPQAAVCNDASCCKAYLDEEALRERWGDKYDEYWQKMLSAVSETDGQYLIWDGQIIQAAFHSSSSGKTEDSGNVWADLPYLVSVDSPETEADVPNYITTVEVSPEDFRRTILGSFPNASLDGDPALWLGEISYNDSVRVDKATIGGLEVSGVQMRGLFSLRSTAFKLEYTGEYFLFTVTGYGHGVGMSQYGANVMAKSGKTYVEILSHYYPGTELVFSAG
ncbi:MAG: stage II sporulation protein D [Oscillospiraceae bacterium]|jgi:stage II sporulation protein D